MSSVSWRVSPARSGFVTISSSVFGPKRKRDIRIYLDSGWPGDNYEATRSMRDRLIWKGYRPGSELFYLAFPEAKHDENAWAARSPIPFQFLFGKLPTFTERKVD